MGVGRRLHGHRPPGDRVRDIPQTDRASVLVCDVDGQAMGHPPPHRRRRLDQPQRIEYEYSGGITLDHGHPSNLYLSRQVSSGWQIERWNTTTAATTGPTRSSYPRAGLTTPGRSSPAAQTRTLLAARRLQHLHHVPHLRARSHARVTVSATRLANVRAHSTGTDDRMKVSAKAGYALRADRDRRQRPFPLKANGSPTGRRSRRLSCTRSATNCAWRA